MVMHGPDERRTPGNTLVVQPDKPFTGLQQVGPLPRRLTLLGPRGC